MHIPDGFLDGKTIIASSILAVGGVSWALRRARQTAPPERRPLMGLAAAFVFAAQMLNFPVMGGTSGHMVGSVLAAALLGPSAAVVVMTAVLIVQCFLFADGGLLALGANTFNMAIVATIGGYGIYRVASRAAGGQRGQVLGAAFAAWCSIVLAATSCAGQLALSGTVAWGIVFPAMVNIHMLIGLGEGLITALVLVAIGRARPELLAPVTPTAAPSYSSIVGYGLLLAVGLVLFVAPHASPLPDGLEKVAEQLGFARRAAAESIVPSPAADYQFPGLDSASRATVLAGLIGAAVAFGLAYGLARALAPSQANKIVAGQKSEG